MIEKQDKVAFLVQYSRLRDRMLILLERRKAYETDIYGIKATNYSDELRGGGLPTGLDVKIVKLLSVTEDIDSELKVITKKMEYIKSVISRLENYKYRSILELKYIDGMTIPQISVILKRSVANVNYNTKRAIKVLPLEDKDIDYII